MSTKIRDEVRNIFDNIKNNRLTIDEHNSHFTPNNIHIRFYDKYWKNDENLGNKLVLAVRDYKDCHCEESLDLWIENSSRLVFNYTCYISMSKEDLSFYEKLGDEKKIEYDIITAKEEYNKEMNLLTKKYEKDLEALNEKHKIKK